MSFKQYVITGLKGMGVSLLTGFFVWLILTVPLSFFNLGNQTVTMGFRILMLIISIPVWGYLGNAIWKWK